jgi:RhoGAP domain
MVRLFLLSQAHADMYKGQTFGVDLEARARADRKRVPLIVTTLLTYLDNHYPDLDGDEARRAIWLVDVPLAASHHLRELINDGNPVSHEVLEKYEIPIVASVLKLYFLELPDPVVSSHVYEIIKTIYNSTATEHTESTRVQVIQNTLGQLRLANIATLDAMTTHFTRLIELTSADDTYIAGLATNLAPCILRPRHETSLTMNERYSYRLIRDLFAHKEAIFGELKRASSLAQRDAATAVPAASSSSNRGRGFSTDERSRRDAERERHQAIAASVGNNRSRATSPAPASRIKRERSPHRMSGGAETRFPVAVASPTTAGPNATPTERRSTLSRTSLEVPGGDGSPITAAPEAKSNGSVAAAITALDGPDTDSPLSAGDKQDSFGRTARAGVARKAQHGGGLGRQSGVYGKDSAGNLRDPAPVAVGEEHRGVELTDKPMDD